MEKPRQCDGFLITGLHFNVRNGALSLHLPLNTPL